MKKSFADCSSCVLKDAPKGDICITNQTGSIEGVDIIITDSINSVSFELAWKNVIEKHMPRYLITKPSLCMDDGFSAVDVAKAAEHCSKNAESIIKMAKPKSITVIGNHSKKIFGSKSNKQFSTFTEFIDHLEKGDAIKPLKVETPLNAPKFGHDEETNLYMFQIPEKFYSKEYRLVDVQRIGGQERIIYIFRDSKNKKHYYEAPAKTDDFYWYEASGDSQIIEPYQNLQLKIGNFKSRNQESNGYGADIHLATLHSADYFLQTEGEAPKLRNNVIHFDIEVYTYHEKTFPQPDKAAYPINAISYITDADGDDTPHILLLNIDGHCDARIKEIIKSRKYPTLTVFNDEYSLVSHFLNAMRKCDIDFICGWNSSFFDIPYLVTRMKHLGVKANQFSPFGNVYANKTGSNIITGHIALDQLNLYKDFTYTMLPSYSLNNVGVHEGVGEKVEHTGSLDVLYRDDVATFIDYSMQDTQLLKNIEGNTQHISIQDELRVVTTASHDSAKSTLGQAEGLFLTSMKKKGLIARNKNHSMVKEKLAGAYVFDSPGGLFNGVLCDFDFTSLYPSIINSWNLGPDTYLARVGDDVAFQYIYQKDDLKNKTFSLMLDPLHMNAERKVNLEQFEKFLADNEASINITGSIFIGHNKKQSVFYTVIDALFNGRKTYKKMMLDAKESGDSKAESVYNGKQMAYKILANSLYGALANEHFRFYSNDLAKSITLAGQELLKYCAVHLDQFLLGETEFKLNTSFMTAIRSLKRVIYGDTDSLFVYLTDYLTEKNIEPVKSAVVIAEIENLQKFVNEKCLDEFIDRHHLNRERCMIFLKNEFLFSKYYALSGKKKYATKVVYQEGKDVEYIDIKGLETKRSEIPKMSQEMLNKLLDMLLDEENVFNVENAWKIVDKYRDTMNKLIDDKEDTVVRMSSFSKPLNEYKNMPQHIKAMQMWNCLVNEDFRHGTKGRLWNLLGIDLTKAPPEVVKKYHNDFLKRWRVADLNVICVPEDEKLPDYFQVDRKKLIEYACDDRANNLLEPVAQKMNQTLLW